MKTSIRKTLMTAVAVLAMTTASSMALAGDSGTIIAVHDEVTTAKFVRARGLPPGQPIGGRYAVVRINNGAYGDASFALVYVPPQFAVHENTVVELNASGVDVLVHPGSAAVYQVLYDEPSSMIKMKGRRTVSA